MSEMSEIPALMPYTYEEVSGCKVRGKAELDRDYQSLINFDGLSNPRKFCGNKILYHYQMKNLLACRRGTKGWRTLEEWFSTPESKEKLWQDAIKRNRRDKVPYPNATDVYECHRLNNGSIVFFKSSTAKYVYTHFNATNVLDPTAGWGGRMLGASSMGIKYTGYDTNTEMVEAYENMKSAGYSTDLQKMIWQDCLTADFSTAGYDLVLTSPPYSNMEIYEHMEGWVNDNAFYNDFMVPLMIKLFNEVECPICINISPKMYQALITSYQIPECDSKIDMRQQLGQQFTTKSQDYIYIWTSHIN